MAQSFDFDAYQIMLADPDFADYGAAQFAEELGVSKQTIYNWNKRIDWDAIKAERRKKFAKPTMEVDRALFRAAKGLDVQAIRTWYERFDQWTPASKVLTEHSVSESEIDEAINGLVERKRAAIAALDASGRGGIEKANGGEIAPAEGRGAEVLPAQPSPGAVHSGDSAGREIHRD